MHFLNWDSRGNDTSSTIPGVKELGKKRLQKTQSSGNTNNDKKPLLAPADVSEAESGDTDLSSVFTETPEKIKYDDASKNAASPLLFSPVSSTVLPPAEPTLVTQTPDVDDSLDNESWNVHGEASTSPGHADLHSTGGICLMRNRPTVSSTGFRLVPAISGTPPPLCHCAPVFLPIDFTRLVIPPSSNLIGVYHGTNLSASSNPIPPLLEFDNSLHNRLPSGLPPTPPYPTEAPPASVPVLLSNLSTISPDIPQHMFYSGIHEAANVSTDTGLMTSARAPQPSLPNDVSMPLLLRHHSNVPPSGAFHGGQQTTVRGALKRKREADDDELYREIAKDADRVFRSPKPGRSRLHSVWMRRVQQQDNSDVHSDENTHTSAILLY